MLRFFFSSATTTEVFQADAYEQTPEPRAI